MALLPQKQLIPDGCGGGGSNTSLIVAPWISGESCMHDSLGGVPSLLMPTSKSNFPVKKKISLIHTPKDKKTFLVATIQRRRQAPRGSSPWAAGGFSAGHGEETRSGGCPGWGTGVGMRPGPRLLGDWAARGPGGMAALCAGAAVSWRAMVPGRAPWAQAVGRTPRSRVRSLCSTTSPSVATLKLKIFKDCCQTSKKKKAAVCNGEGRAQLKE